MHLHSLIVGDLLDRADLAQGLNLLPGVTLSNVGQDYALIEGFPEPGRTFVVHLGDKVAGGSR